MADGHECGMHAHLHPVAAALADRKQFDDVAELSARFYVRFGYVRYALAVYAGIRNAGMESKRREYGQLIRRVEALDVRRRIEFRIAELLRFFECVGVAHALVRHFGQYIVGRAVDYTDERVHLIGLQAFLQSADDGHAAHAGRFEVQTRAALFRGGFEVGPVLGHELLVCGHYALARAQHFFYESLGGFDAAHGFDDYGNILVRRYLVHRGRGFAVGYAERPYALEILVEHFGNLEIDALGLSQEVAVLGEDFVGAAADGAYSHYGYVDLFHSSLLAGHAVHAFGLLSL